MLCNDIFYTKLAQWCIKNYLNARMFVAVHSSRQIKITDFGLAKLLGDKVDSYQATGGKVRSVSFFTNR